MNFYVGIWKIIIKLLSVKDDYTIHILDENIKKYETIK